MNRLTLSRGRRRLRGHRRGQGRSGRSSAYADANGFIDVQALTCGQLANTYQEDANALTSWYSGWYNGLAHKHYADFKKGRIVEHQVIEYCKAHPSKKSSTPSPRSSRRIAPKG